jgi:hypothetical protein
VQTSVEPINALPVAEPINALPVAEPINVTHVIRATLDVSGCTMTTRSGAGG